MKTCQNLLSEPQKTSYQGIHQKQLKRPQRAIKRHKNDNTMPFGKETSPHVGVKFGQGQDPTRGGRPKSYQSMFDECLTEEERRATIEVLKKKALSGDLKAIEMIMNRVDGRPTQAHEFKSQPVMPIIIMNPLDEEE